VIGKARMHSAWRMAQSEMRIMDIDWGLLTIN